MHDVAKKKIIIIKPMSLVKTLAEVVRKMLLSFLVSVLSFPS